ncbi:MAG: hypothetical protein Q9169_004149 [Polycauliona sp. 2 TL-2023]
MCQLMHDHIDEIDAHICRMLGITLSDYNRNLSVAEQLALRDHYDDTIETMGMHAHDGSSLSEADKEDFEARFIGASHPLDPYQPNMENAGIEMTNMDSPSTTHTQNPERPTTNNLEATDGYIAHHPDNKEAEAPQSTTNSILSFNKSDGTNTLPQATATDIGLQVGIPSIRNVPFKATYQQSQYQAVVHEFLQHICAMENYRGFSPEELRMNDYLKAPKVEASLDFGGLRVPSGEFTMRVPVGGKIAETAKPGDVKETSTTAVAVVPAEGHWQLKELLVILLMGIMLGHMF